MSLGAWGFAQNLLGITGDFAWGFPSVYLGILQCLIYPGRSAARMGDGGHDNTTRTLLDERCQVLEAQLAAQH